MRTLLAVIFSIFIAASANAEVKETIVQLTLNVPDQTIDLDIDANGVVDFQMLYDVYQKEPYLHINVPEDLQETNKIVVTGEHNKYGKDLVAKLDVGIYVSATSTFNGAIFGNGPLVAQPSSAGADILEGQKWAIVGFSFARDGEVHYGWMSVTVNADGTEAVVGPLVWESNAGDQILTAFFTEVRRESPTACFRQIGARLFETGEGSNVQVTDLLGREVLHQSNVQLLDLSHLLPGVYFIKLEGSEGEAVEKLTLY